MSVFDITCDVCGNNKFKVLFEKESSRNETFTVVRCLHCGLVQVNPQPDLASVEPYYDNSYFIQRTDRGYDNYYSLQTRQALERVYELNLRDLGFFNFEKRLYKNNQTPVALDAGCAAGYFVDYMKNRGWKSYGVEVSNDISRYARETLGLDILTADFLTCDELKIGSFDMLTFWASIEHMHSPMKVLYRANELLKKNGRMILSTCRYGLLAKLRGKEWRYMNVPEHLYFFSMSGIKKAARKAGFTIEKSISYGSGLTAKKNASSGYLWAKAIADPTVKLLNQGDMMALMLRKD